MADKIAIIVVGPESSGTKFLTKLFIDAGFYGDNWHTQRLDEKIPDVKQLVFRRSYPHGDEWPALGDIIERFKIAGYLVKVVVIVRSMQFCVESRARKDALNLPNIKFAFSLIGEQLFQTRVDYVWVTYEAILLYKMKTLAWLFEQLGVQPPPTSAIKIKDANRKYMEPNRTKRSKVKVRRK